MGHRGFVVKCSCGKVIAQCRCMCPNKAVRVVQHGCEDCKKQRSEGA